MKQTNTHLTNQESPEEQFKQRLREALRQHRKELGLTQVKTAELFHIASSTYERWESDKSPTCIFSLLDVFRTLKFTTTEVIDLLGLPPLTADELEEISPDEETLKRLKGESIYTYVRRNCKEMTDFTIDKLLILLLDEEHSRRLPEGKKESPTM